MSCTESLEIAIRSTDSNIVHFLHREGFITLEEHDDILNPKSMLNEHQKARALVTGIRNKVQLSPQGYHTLLKYLHVRKRKKYYESIVKILDEEYSRQEQTGK